MKSLVALGFIVLSGIALASCKMTSDDDGKKAKKINPEDVLGRIPPGIPKEEGSLYEISGLAGLISHGDSLLVQVSPLTSREALTWDKHSENANRAATDLLLGGALEKFVLTLGDENLIRIPSSDNEELEFKYFYIQPNQNKAKKNTENAYALRAICFGRERLYEPESSCFFSYRKNQTHIEFTLDEQTVANGSLKSIENIVFDQLNIDQ